MTSDFTFVDKEKVLQSVEKYKHDISTIQWQDFDQKIRYKILRIQEKESRFQAKSFLTEIMARRGQRSKIFAPSAMVQRIKEERKSNQSVYLIPTGQKNHGTKTYNMCWLHMVIEVGARMIEEWKN